MESKFTDQEALIAQRPAVMQYYARERAADRAGGLTAVVEIEEILEEDERITPHETRIHLQTGPTRLA